MGRAAPSLHSRLLGNRARRSSEGVDRIPKPPGPLVFCFLFLPPCLPLHPGLGAWAAGGTRGEVITGHSRLRVRMEEAQLSAGTHQRPNQALAAGRRGRAANEKGVPARCSQPGFS